MKKPRLSTVLVGVLFLVGAGVMLYPTMSDLYVRRQLQKELAQYNQVTQGEEADLHSRLTPERFQDFRPGQRDFFLRLMALLDIRQEDCAPEVLANLVFSCLLIYNSAPESMPFLFPSHLEETAALHVKFLVNYLGSLRNAKKDR